MADEEQLKLLWQEVADWNTWREEHSAVLHPDLVGADLNEARLDGADLSGADLHRARLEEAYLRGAYLHGARLRKANLRSARLIGAAP